jgi:phosphoribosylanthranilate isomerase
LKRNQCKIIKAFGVNESFDFPVTKEYSDFCELFLFDTKSSDYGGTGRKFDWRTLENYRGTVPFLLSGGIDYEDFDIISKINHPQFLGVDLNSRFEIMPGIKDIEKIKLFKNKISNIQK